MSDPIRRRKTTAKTPVQTAQVTADRYRAAVEAGDLDVLEELYHADVLLDAHVPNWRSQVQGARVVAEMSGTGLPSPGRFTSFDVEPTASGDLLVQFEWHQAAHQGGHVSRELHVRRLDGERIVEHVVFCAGVWDQHLQARMADEAPLIRP